MSAATMFRVACLALGLALLGASSAGPQRDASPDGVRGGTLRVLAVDPIIGLDTAVNYTPQGLAIARAYPALTATPPDRPDSQRPQLSADRATAHSPAAGVATPPGNRESPPPLLTAIQPLRKTTIAGAASRLIAGPPRYGREGQPHLGADRPDPSTSPSPGPAHGDSCRPHPVAFAR